MTKGYNKLISSQASQMQITIEKLGKSKKYPISLNAAKYLYIESYNRFHKSCIDQIYFHLSIQLDRSIHISRDESSKQPRKFGDKNDRCSCKEARGYLRQCVHEIILINRFELKYFDIRWKDRDMVTCCPDLGIYKNPKITEYLEINDVDILRTDETMIESYDETISVTKENDESVQDILTQTSLVSPIDSK